MRQAGAEEFRRSYVSSGKHTYIAHGYSTDLCRTVCAGKPTKEQQDAYAIYPKAQQSTIAEVKAGIGVRELEEMMHEILKADGNCGLYPGNFGVRVEDTVVVKEKGYEMLTGYPG